MKFQCSGCGACCKRAGKMGFMPQRADGACIHLSEDNKCKIYDTRPDMCNVKKMYERFKSVTNMTERQHYENSNSICNQWIKEDGLDDSFLINIGKYGSDASPS